MGVCCCFLIHSGAFFWCIKILLKENIYLIIELVMNSCSTFHSLTLCSAYWECKMLHTKTSEIEGPKGTDE